MLNFGYNTNGFAHHRLEDAVQIIADLGYRSIALTLDHFALNPFDRGLHRQMGEIRTILERHHLKSVVESGARFLLDARKKHQPTLMAAESWQRQYRLEFLRRAVWIAEALGSDCVSFWSGTPTDERSAAEHFAQLVEGCQALCETATERKVNLAFEPEPGMMIDTTARYDKLAAAVNHPRFGLTLDIGHLQVQGEPIPETIRKYSERLWNIHIEDAKRGTHDHLMFGEGEIDFSITLATLKEVNYTGGVNVELSRHSHDAVETARRSLEFLRTRMKS